MQTISSLSAAAETDFDLVPREYRRRVYGVPYVQLDDSDGGRLWVTRHGWPLLSHVDPASWYFDDQYRERGQRLSSGSGAVYRVPTAGRVAREVELVVKFSRMGQDVPLHVSSQFPHDVPRHVIDGASFNDPLKEFSVLTALRSSRFGPPQLRILTKRPLAIYSPGTLHPAWKLGRTEGCFQRHQYALAKDQRSYSEGKAVEFSIERRYLCLYHWVRGVDAETLRQRGVLSGEQIAGLMQRVIRELAAKGFRMLDIKPSHLILRARSDGSLLRRRGELVYVLVDFELLQYTEAYLEWAQQRAT